MKCEILVMFCLLNTDIWQQYDGVVNAVPEKSIIQWVWDTYESNLLQNLKVYIRCCCPFFEYFNENSNSLASEVLQSLEMMFKSLEDTYFYPLKYWKKKTLDDFRKHLNKVSIFLMLKSEMRRRQ
jgi:hypothetical protein